MGYTHYWTDPAFIPTPAQWAELCKRVKPILVKHSAVIGRESNTPGLPPEISPDLIAFNGIGDLGHETFWLERDSEARFNFCKTARKPYDAAVVEVLRAVQETLPGWLQLSSDGDGDQPCTPDNPDGKVFPDPPARAEVEEEPATEDPDRPSFTLEEAVDRLRVSVERLAETFKSRNF